MGPRTCSSGFKIPVSWRILQDSPYFQSFPLRDALGYLCSLRINHRIIVFQSQKETSKPYIFYPMSQIVERLFISGPICYMFFYLQSYFKRLQNYHKKSKMVLIHDTATSPKISFLFISIIDSNLGKAFLLSSKPC